MTQARFFSDREDSKATPTTLRAVPSHCPQLLSLQVPPGWQERIWEGLSRCCTSCRSRAEGPGVRGLDLPLLHNAPWSSIAQNKPGKIPRFQLLASENGVRRRESSSCPNISVTDTDRDRPEGPGAVPWAGNGGGKAGLKCWEFNRDKKTGSGPFAPVSCPCAPQPEPPGLYLV